MGHNIATYLEGSIGGVAGAQAGEQIGGGAIGGVARGVLGELIGPEGIIPPVLSPVKR